MKFPFIVLRLTGSIAIGLAVFFISVLTNWRASPQPLMNNNTIDSWSISSIQIVDELIRNRIAEGAPPPESLQELSSELADRTFPNSEVPRVKNGVIIDGWGRPLLYSADSTTGTLMSYGRDGKPGGTGFDRDIDSSQYDTFLLDFNEPVFEDPPMPTLHQYLFELPTTKMTQGCAISGFLAFLAAFFMIRPTRLTHSQTKRLLYRILITLAVAVLLSRMIAGLHIPSGH